MFINIRTEYISGIVCDKKGNFMAHNPDIYLLYEYMDKLSFTFRIKVRLTEAVDADVLKEAAQKAFERFPYFRVKVGLDTGGNFTLEPNEKPIAVLPEENKRIALGSPEVNEHLLSSHTEMTVSGSAVRTLPAAPMARCSGSRPHYSCI